MTVRRGLVLSVGMEGVILSGGMEGGWRGRVGAVSSPPHPSPFPSGPDWLTHVLHEGSGPKPCPPAPFLTLIREI